MEEVLRLARLLAAGEIDVDAVWAMGHLTEQERGNVVALAVYEIQRRQRKSRRAQRRACGLLRSLLTPAQCAERRRRKTITVQGSAGGRYRLYPACGSVWRVERHGRYDIGIVAYCLHDPDRQMPPADETVGHLLRLVTDEPGFLALANASPQPHLGWDGTWHRRLRMARALVPPSEEQP